MTALRGDYPKTAIQKSEYRYGPVPSMIGGLVDQIAPGLRQQLVNEFTELYKPVGIDCRIVEYLAYLVSHVRGCQYLDTQRFAGADASGAGLNKTSDQASPRALMETLTSPRLIEKTEGYRAQLQHEVARTVRHLLNAAKNRKLNEQRQIDQLMRAKVCTPVIQ